MTTKKDYLDSLLMSYLKNKNLKIAVSDKKNCTLNEFKNKVLNYKKKLETIWDSGTKKNRGVAILLDRDADYISIIFAAWLTKGFYLPLSLSSPKKNIHYQLQNSGVTVLVYKKKNKVYFSKLNLKTNNTPKLVKNNFKKIAYIIFTSGSTGEKKGVCISRQNLISYFKAINKIFKNKFKAKSVLINGELTFDISSADFVFALLFKCEIILTNDSRNLLSLLHKLDERKAESIYVVPSTLEKLINFLDKYKSINLEHVKQLNCGGEILPYNLIKKISSRIPNARIYNFYGPTEFTINSTFFEVNLNKPQKTIIPIGKLLPGNNFFLKKKTRNNNTGELYLNGEQRMLGYVNYLDPSIKVNGKIFYPTGDIVALDKNKDFIFLGRDKDYIKVSGYRVNLIRVENIIRENLNLSSVIIVHKRKIMLFVKHSNLKDRSVLKKLKSVFNKKLERYEIPYKTIFIKHFPLNMNGKIDKKKLIKKI